eukprot:11212695-Lingulodinium_polyedra.AAC.1
MRTGASARSAPPPLPSRPARGVGLAGRPWRTPCATSTSQRSPAMQKASGGRQQQRPPSGNGTAA